MAASARQAVANRVADGRGAVAAPAVASVCPRLIQKARVIALVGSAWQQRQSQEARQPGGVGAALKKELRESVSWMGAVLPFATAIQSNASATAEIYGAIAKALDIYLLVLTLRVILTWFRNINWSGEPFVTLRQFTDPFLNTFRGILPSFGGIDVSPMIGFLLLNFVRNQLVHLSRTINQ
ncbi:hypothetical protein GPECTOR_2g1089 [Gonium pectorale]|uniref:YGGT protein n=1 Tax=Gonium pectorale TaxID=33097 RepID=A0A150H1S9_GONPE|nr:hypothetical protein GPECTOR_2g1089 [Gonium pectorale]|eukprot:KXZ55540.1 hypothetical protein GPECTOR_2g1089 [Gonium pectorale]